MRRVWWGCLVAGALVLTVLGTGQWFHGDEWDPITTRTLGDLPGLLRPHNDHLSFVPLVVFRVVFFFVGIVVPSSIGSFSRPARRHATPGRTLRSSSTSRARCGAARANRTGSRPASQRASRARTPAGR